MEAALASQTKTKSLPYLDLLFISLLSILIYTAIAILLPLQVNTEGQPLLILQDTFASGHWCSITFNGVKLLATPPLYYWLAAAYTKLFSASLLSLRILSIVLSLITLNLTYATMHYVYNRSIALVTTLILATSLVFVGLACFATPLPLAILLFTACLYSAICLSCCTQNHVKFFVLCFWAALALFTLAAGLYFTLLTLLSWIVWAIVQQDKFTARRFASIRGLILFFVVIGLWLFFTANTNPHFIKFYFIDTLNDAWSSLQNNHYNPFWQITLAALLGFMPWTIFLANAVWYNKPASWDTRQNEPMGILLFTFTLVLVLGLLFVNVNNLWVGLFMPIFSLMCGRYLAAGIDLPHIPLQSRAYEVLFIATIVAFAALMTQAFHHYRLHHYSALYFFGYVMLYLILSALIVLPILRYANIKKGIITLIILSYITYLATAVALKLNPTHDLTNLANFIKARAKTEDVIAAYQHYPLSVRLALNKNIVMIDWQEEPSYAKRYQPDNAWFTSMDNFWDTISKNHRKIYLITSMDDFLKLQKQYPKLKLVQMSGDFVVVSN